MPEPKSAAGSGEGGGGGTWGREGGRGKGREGGGGGAGGKGRGEGEGRRGGSAKYIFTLPQSYVPIGNAAIYTVKSSCHGVLDLSLLEGEDPARNLKGGGGTPLNLPLSCLVNGECGQPWLTGQFVTLGSVTLWSHT